MKVGQKCVTPRVFAYALFGSVLDASCARFCEYIVLVILGGCHTQQQCTNCLYCPCRFFSKPHPAPTHPTPTQFQPTHAYPRTTPSLPRAKPALHHHHPNVNKSLHKPPHFQQRARLSPSLLRHNPTHQPRPNLHPTPTRLPPTRPAPENPELRPLPPRPNVTNPLRGHPDLPFTTPPCPAPPTPHQAKPRPHLFLISCRPSPPIPTPRATQQPPFIPPSPTPCADSTAPHTIPPPRRGPPLPRQPRAHAAAHPSPRPPPLPTAPGPNGWRARQLASGPSFQSHAHPLGPTASPDASLAPGRARRPAQQRVTPPPGWGSKTPRASVPHSRASARAGGGSGRPANPSGPQPVATPKTASATTIVPQTRVRQAPKILPFCRHARKQPARGLRFPDMRETSPWAVCVLQSCRVSKVMRF